MFIESSKPSSIIKDQSLTTEVEKWLESNKATIIPRGVSTQTSYTRSAPEPKPRQPKPKPEPKPKPPKPPKPKAVKKPKPPKAERQNIKVCITGLFSEFKERKRKGDVNKLASLLGLHIRTMSAWLADETVPKNRESEIRKILSEFYYKPFVQKDRYLRSPKKMLKPDLHCRVQYNSIMFKKAKESGVKTFTASCVNHGDAEFVIRGERYRCLKCLGVGEKKRPVAKLKIASAATMCKRYNAEKKQIAIEKGLSTFDGICSKHQFQIYSLFNGRHRCAQCSVEIEAERKIKEGIKPQTAQNRANRKLMEAELKRNPGAKNFKGVCLRHGEQKFQIQKAVTAKSGLTFGCFKCRRVVQ